jgi:hypothetical protein
MDGLWVYRADVISTEDLTGYDVEATDGSIGRIDEASHEVGASYLVVDTGFWIFGKRRLIPAAAVQRIDDAEQKVYVGLTKDQVKSAPDFEDQHRSDLAEHETYFSANVW